MTDILIYADSIRSPDLRHVVPIAIGDAFPYAECDGRAYAFVSATLAHTRSPVLQASKVRTPCLNVAGANDRCTPPGQAREFHHALLAYGVESVLAIYPEEGHGVPSFPAITDFLTRVVSWFEKHMPPDRDHD